MEESELFKSNGKSSSETYSGGVGGGGYIGGRQNMTDEHRTALHKIKDRDTQMDAEIMEIGKVVDELGGMARTMNEEVKIQSKMIDSLGAKIDDVHGHVTNINAKLKTTIEEARKSDKICMDILCLIILIGMIIVLVKVSEKNKVVFTYCSLISLTYILSHLAVTCNTHEGVQEIYMEKLIKSTSFINCFVLFNYVKKVFCPVVKVVSHNNYYDLLSEFE